MRELLAKKFMVTYDEAGSIGKRYTAARTRSAPPFCVTIDFDTLENNTVTIRDRDTMSQIRLDIGEVAAYIEKAMEH